MHGGWSERGTVTIRLTREHFAFFRGYLDELDLRMLANRYLHQSEDSADATKDLRIAKSTVAWIREQLLIAARRAGIGYNARLFLLPPESLHVEYAPDIPSLDEFRQERDPYEVYTEEELISLYEEEYKADSGKNDRRTQRNKRLRTNQLAALAQLESLVTVEPTLNDPVDGWIDPALANRLQAAEIITLKDLVECINGWGYRWYAKVPKIGEKAAVQITHWLNSPEVCKSLGISLTTRCLVKKKDLPSQVPAVYAPRTDIVPLENFLLPLHLNGSQGSNRGKQKDMNAENDLDAIHEWLSQWQSDSSTYRASRKHVERFLIWSILEKGKALSSLSVEDCQDYRDFLVHIGSLGQNGQNEKGYETKLWSLRFRIPQDEWIVKGTNPGRWSPLWRPFKGKLCASSQTGEIVVLNSFLQYLKDRGYLRSNPMRAISKTVKLTIKIDTNRSFFHDEWQAIVDYLHSLKAKIEKQPEIRTNYDNFYRLQFMLYLAYSTGMRLSELAMLRRHHVVGFSNIESGETYLWFEFDGKNEYVREIPITSRLLNHLNVYFKHRGHPNFLDAPLDTPLIAALPQYESSSKKVRKDTLDLPISNGQIYTILKSFFGSVAKELEESHPAMARIIKSGSTHWLRHTHANHSLARGMDIVTLSRNLGNKDLTSSLPYRENHRDRQSREVELFGPEL